ncbi:MAG: triose-phosphate isomerase [Eubacteriales bacterium]|nr:triose-phosphate isomerase [Eubacteriales bacterium]
MRKKLYFGSNFKMYKDGRATREYLQAMMEAVGQIDRERVQFFFIPSFTSLESAARCEAREAFLLGAQNMCWEEEGQFTGEISPGMLKELGVDLVMVGHSERRHGFGETDEMVNRKVRKALEWGFTTLLCVGETASEKEFGVSVETLRRQLKIGLHGVTEEQVGKVWIAYEPVWSIGVQGTPAPVDYAQEMHREIRGCLGELFGEMGREIPVLYGGSVNAGNGVDLITQEDIDGLFTTRTAFQVESFAGLIQKAVSAVETLS